MQHEQAEPEHRDAEPEARGALAEGPGRARSTGAERAGRLARGDSRGHSPLPDSAMICVTMPVSSSKNLSDSVAPAPEVVGDGEQVRRPSGNGSDGIVGTLDLAVVDAVDDGRKPLRANCFWPSALEDEVEPVLRLGVGVDEDRARVLDEHRGLGDDVVELLAVLVGEDRLVLVGHQHVAGAAEERGGGVTAAARQRDDVVEEAR